MNYNRVQKFEEITTSMFDLYKRKNADYGNSFHDSYVEFGIIASVVRLSDKFNRLKSLTKGNHPNFESVEDTLKDIIGYCTLTLNELQP